VDGDVSIDKTEIEPKQLCELGGEKIIIPLSVRCPKKGEIINSDNLQRNIRYI